MSTPFDSFSDEHYEDPSESEHNEEEIPQPSAATELVPPDGSALAANQPTSHPWKLLKTRC